MITMIQLDGGWVGAGGQPGPAAKAIAFDGKDQRERAFGWMRSLAGKDAMLADIMTQVPRSEQAMAARVVCACGKVLQNGAGKLSHGICGECAKKALEGLEAGK